MSVLIEALTMVVPRRELDIRYPGGTDAFLEATLRLERPPRFCVGLDPHLVSVSFYDPEHMDPALELLSQHGFIDVDESRMLDVCYVDQHHGPTMPCDWLEWRRHEAGFTYAWLADTEPGDMAAPEGWTPEDSKRLTRRDIRDEEGRMLQLADEDGLETWLDLNTGMQVQSLAHRAEPENMEESMSDDAGRQHDELELEAVIRQLEEELELNIETPTMGRLLRSLVAGLEEMGCEFHLQLDRYLVTTSQTSPRTRYRVVLLADEQAGVISCLVSAAFRVPEADRLPICETLNRINYGHLRIGSFEMDMDDGEVVFRVAQDHEDTEVSPRLVKQVIGASLGTFEQYLPAIMQVIHSGVSPEDAITEVQP